MSSKTYRHNCASAMQIEQEPCIALDFQYLSIRKDAPRQCKLSKLLCIALDFHYLSIRKDAARQCKLSKLLCIALDFHYLCNPIASMLWKKQRELT